MQWNSYTLPAQQQWKLPDIMKSIVMKMKINTPEVNYFDLAENPHTLHFRQIK